MFMTMTDRGLPLPTLPLLAVLWVVFLCFLFGANAVAIKISLKGLGVFTTAGLRFGAASVVIGLWALATGQPLQLQKKQMGRLIIISLIFFVQLSLFYTGLSKTHASRGTLLANIQPFFVLFLAHFFVPGDRISWRKLVGIMLAFGGVTLVFLDPAAALSDLKMGDMIILTAAFVWACNGVYTKRILRDLSPFQVVLYPTLVATPLFFIEALVFEEVMIRRIETQVVLAVMYQAVVATAFGFVAWNTLLRKYGAVAMHSFIFIMPMAGVLLGGLILKEPITPNVITALLLIVTGILLVNAKGRKEMAIVHPGRNV
jgi:drug/metabolite transporter (DMT)-like permease